MISILARRNKVFRNIGLYTLLNFVNSAIPFLLLPVFTNYLSKFDFGIVDLFTTFSFIFIPIVGLNIGSSIIRYYYELDKNEFSNFISTILTFLCLLGGVIVVIVYFVFLVVKPDYFEGGIPIQIVWLSVLYALFTQIIEVLLNIFRVEEKPALFGLLRITKTTMDILLSVYFIVYLNYGWEGRIYPMLFVSGLICIAAILFIRKLYGFKFLIHKTYLKIALSYSVPLIVHTLGGYILAFSDRLVIAHYLGVDEVGLYAVAYQIGMIMSFLGTSFNQAWTPFVFSILKKDEGKGILKLKKYNLVYFATTFIVALAIYLAVPLIYELFINNDFIVNYYVVLWVLIGYSFFGMYKFVVNFLFYFKKTKLLAGITLVSSLINLILNFILVPVYGLLGAAVSTTIAFFILFCIVYYFYHRLCEVHLLK
ncbi:oligosaccharide flippase family protein [Echinicola marina]|uniref:oligosaccharide flippase family protein n=1 Tax=Echinicola marina TaxID=2859768 RepID=UPI001CF64D71|nr:oligosaccharide flippase family protein [Echinicola marina]UCS93240.1 oligosaccharide flippase family protein [Echinicola marina]